MKIDQLNTAPDNSHLTESSGIPIAGDIVRTAKMEGKVSKVEEGYVYFTTKDGRNMRNTVENCTVVEKLIDQECCAGGDEELDEVSTELLAKYKTAAGKDATAADKKGDYARGNKRFSGIVKATKKQFDNNAKKVSESTDDLNLIWRKVEEVVSNIWPDGDPHDWLAPWAKKHGINYEMFDRAAQANGYTDVYDYYNSMSDLAEGGMGGINRSAPSTDVSYEQVLDRNPETAHSKVVGEEDLNELSVDRLRAYKDAARSPESFRGRPLSKLAKTIQGVRSANDRIKVKTGDRRQGPASTREGTYESKLAEFLKLDENKQEVNVGITQSGKPGLFTNGMMAVPLSMEEYLIATEDAAYLEKLAGKYGFVVARRPSVDEDRKDDLGEEFADILGRQSAETKVVKKIDITKLPSKNENFAIWFRPQTDKLKPVKWQVRNKDGSVIRHEDSSSNEKDAFNDAEDWIAKSGETSSASNNVTVNFNAAFAREVAPEGQTLWTTFWEGPIFVYSESPKDGYTRTVIRTPEHSRTAGAALLPVTGMSPKKANEIGLRTNSRYTLGPREELEPGVYGYTLQWHSRVEKGTPVPLKEPSITTSSKEEAVNELYQGPHLGDTDKLANAPKTSMSGSDSVRFSELVQDSIKSHGVKWAFNYYVKKHGLPPRQFQIFAGLTPGPKAVAASKPGWDDPSRLDRPRPQSWWQKLRGKLPFEE